MKRYLLAALCLTFASVLHAEERMTDKVDWKLFFNQMFALEIKKEALSQPNAAHETMIALDRYTAYTPKTFNETIAKVLQSSTSSEAYKARRDIYYNQKNYDRISKLDFAASVPRNVQRIPAVASYLKSIKDSQDRPIASHENFFDSPEAQQFLRAITYASGQAASQDVVFLMVPGFAAHAIKFGIFPELAADMNIAWGREASRPVLSEQNGIDFNYESYQLYYSKSHNGPVGFDIIGPAGGEMGNTAGLNSETGDLMAKWIAGLPPAYSKRKFFLLGYSKGTPVVLEMLKRNPELKSRFMGMVTFAGVFQGTHIARTGMSEIKKMLSERSVGELITTLRRKGLKDSLKALVPFISDFDLGFLNIDTIKEIMGIYDVDSTDLQPTVDRLLDGRELREILDGAKDMSPLERTAWNLNNLDNNLMAPGTFLFNISGVTDISDFAARSAANNERRRMSSLISPQLNAQGKLNFKSLSLDAWFLYLSSIDGFKLAPGGLYDTQVELQHTKTPWLDTSPLSSSLTSEELKELWSRNEIRQKMFANGIMSLEQMSQTPRSKLLKAEHWNHIRAYDLGEFKGHHWSLFHQAFRAPKDVSTDYQIWEFPRKAFMRALLQTIALYNVVNQNS